MKRFFTLATALFSLFVITSKLNAQCTLDASMDTQAEILACLTTCGCSQIIVPSTVAVDLTGVVDLTSKGIISITIQNGGSLIFSGSGGSADELILAAGSSLVINSPGTNALVQSGGGGIVRITVGTTTYTGGGFAALIAAGGNGVVLDATLKSFKVNSIKTAASNLLSWETASEINSKGFQVERRSNNSDWSVIGTVNAQGKPSNYEFIDKTPLSMSYYRLRQIDFDGKENLSKTVSIYKNNSSNSVKIYPNPVGTEGYITVETDENLRGVVITNMLGQVVLTSKTGKINVSQLTHGMYNIAVKTETETKTQKFLKQ